MKKYIKPKVLVIDMKAMGVMAGTDMIISSGTTNQNPDYNDGNSGTFSAKRHSFFNWEESHYSVWDD